MKSIECDRSQTRYRPKGDIVYRQLPDRAIILNGQTGQCFEVNALGADVWVMLDGHRTPAEICNHLREVFSRAPTNLEMDVQTFLTELEDAGLTEAI